MVRTTRAYPSAHGSRDTGETILPRGGILLARRTVEQGEAGRIFTTKEGAFMISKILMISGLFLIAMIVVASFAYLNSKRRAIKNAERQGFKGW